MHRCQLDPSRTLILLVLTSALLGGCDTSTAVLVNPAASRALQDMECDPVPVCGADGTPGDCQLPENAIWHPDARAKLEECISRGCGSGDCIEQAADGIDGIDGSGELVARCEDAVGRCSLGTDACAALPIVDAEVQRAIDDCAGESCGSLGDCYAEALLGSAPE